MPDEWGRVTGNDFMGFANALGAVNSVIRQKRRDTLFQDQADRDKERFAWQKANQEDLAAQESFANAFFEGFNSAEDKRSFIAGVNPGNLNEAKGLGMAMNQLNKNDAFVAENVKNAQVEGTKKYQQFNQRLILGRDYLSQGRNNFAERELTGATQDCHHPLFLSKNKNGTYDLIYKEAGIEELVGDDINLDEAYKIAGEITPAQYVQDYVAQRMDRAQKNNQALLNPKIWTNGKENIQVSQFWNQENPVEGTLFVFGADGNRVDGGQGMSVEDLRKLGFRPENLDRQKDLAKIESEKALTGTRNAAAAASRASQRLSEGKLNALGRKATTKAEVDQYERSTQAFAIDAGQYGVQMDETTGVASGVVRQSDWETIRNIAGHHGVELFDKAGQPIDTNGFWPGGKKASLEIQVMPYGTRKFSDAGKGNAFMGKGNVKKNKAGRFVEKEAGNAKSGKQPSGTAARDRKTDLSILPEKVRDHLNQLTQLPYPAGFGPVSRLNDSRGLFKDIGTSIQQGLSINHSDAYPKLGETKVELTLRKLGVSNDLRKLKIIAESLREVYPDYTDKGIADMLTRRAKPSK